MFVSHCPRHLVVSFQDLPHPQYFSTSSRIPVHVYWRSWTFICIKIILPACINPYCARPLISFYPCRLGSLPLPKNFKALCLLCILCRNKAAAAVVSTLPVFVYFEPRKPSSDAFGCICVVLISPCWVIYLLTLNNWSKQMAWSNRKYFSVDHLIYIFVPSDVLLFSLVFCICMLND